MSFATKRIVMSGPLGEDGLHRLLKLLASDGDSAFVVGGAVRNSLISYPVSDIDIATTVVPEIVIERATAQGMRAVPTGVAHGTVTVIVDGQSYEVTTLREDVQTDGRHATVRFGTDYAKDAARRDFTMNALYADASGQVYDYVGGLDDLLFRRVRFIGDARTRIKEDYLRILRFFRFSADYAQGRLDEEGLAAIDEEKAGLQHLSSERLRVEMLKLLMARRAVPVLTVMSHQGIFDLILGLTVNVEALGALLEHDPGADALLRLAAFCVHKADDADVIKERLRLSNAETDRITQIGKALMLLSIQSKRLEAKGVRKLAFRLGRRALSDALAIDGARRGYVVEPSLFEAAGGAPTLSPFTGEILLKRGLSPGRQIGEIIRRAEEAWMDADFPTEPATLGHILHDSIKHLS